MRTGRRHCWRKGPEQVGVTGGDKPRRGLGRQAQGWMASDRRRAPLFESKQMIGTCRQTGQGSGSPHYCARLEEGVIVEPMEGGRVPVCVTVCLKVGVRIPPSLLANRTRESPGCCFPGLLFCLVIPGFQEVSGHVVWNGL